jgi:hypothetical protein
MAGHRTAVRFPPTVWRGLKLRALDYDTSAVALVRQALTDALDGHIAALAASSHQYRDTPGQLVTLDLRQLARAGAGCGAGTGRFNAKPPPAQGE